MLQNAMPMLMSGFVMYVADFDGEVVVPFEGARPA